MFLFPCIYQPEQHEIIRSDIIDWCKRQTKAPAEQRRWFMYRHRIHGTFVIARWAGDKFGVFTDFLNLGHSLANFNQEKAMEFRHRLYAPVTPDAINRAVAGSQSNYHSIMNDKNDNVRTAMRNMTGRRDIWK